MRISGSAAIQIRTWAWLLKKVHEVVAPSGLDLSDKTILHKTHGGATGRANGWDSLFYLHSRRANSAAVATWCEETSRCVQTRRVLGPAMWTRTLRSRNRAASVGAGIKSGSTSNHTRLLSTQSGSSRSPRLSRTASANSFAFR